MALEPQALERSVGSLGPRDEISVRTQLFNGALQKRLHLTHFRAVGKAGLFPVLHDPGGFSHEQRQSVGKGALEGRAFAQDRGVVTAAGAQKIQRKKGAEWKKLHIFVKISFKRRSIQRHDSDVDIVFSKQLPDLRRNGGNANIRSGIPGSVIADQENLSLPAGFPFLIAAAACRPPGKAGCFCHQEYYES